jgi:hypothetical protein
LDLRTLTLSEFLCDGKCSGEDQDTDVFGMLHTNATKAQGEIIRDLGQGYTVLAVDGVPGNVRLAHEGLLVGFYEGETIAISRQHQGHQLSVPLILAAVVDRPLPTSRKLFTGGKIALKRAWRVANGLDDNPWP